MGLEKFMDDGLGKKNIDKSENIHITNKDYKNIHRYIFYSPYF